MEIDISTVLDAAHEQGYEIWEIRGDHRWGVLLCPKCTSYQDIPVRPRAADRHLRRIQEFTSEHQPHVAIR